MLQVLAVGDLAVVACPGEVFSETTLATRQASPFAQTLVLGLSNGYIGYTPPAIAFDHGGYEPTIGYHSRPRRGAAERISDIAAQLMHEHEMAS